MKKITIENYQKLSEIFPDGLLLNNYIYHKQNKLKKQLNDEE